MVLDPHIMAVAWPKGTQPKGGTLPLLAANCSPFKPFNSTSLQPLILKGFDKSPQLNIK